MDDRHDNIFIPPILQLPHRATRNLSRFLSAEKFSFHKEDSTDSRYNTLIFVLNSIVQGE